MNRLKNIHVAPRIDLDQAPENLPRLRQLKNDPQREYASRPGQVQRLPDEMAAIILCAQRWATVARDEIRLEIDGQKRRYFHPDSLTIRGTGDERRVLVCYNRHDPSVIHVLKEDGEYVETIPEKGKAEFFDQSAAARELAASRHHQARVADRMQVLHQADTQRAVQDARHNGAELAKVVRTMPLEPSYAEGTEAAGSRLPRADRLAKAFATVDRNKARQAATDRRVRATSGDLSDIYGDRAPKVEAPEQEESSMHEIF
jgi:hypothetical protein